MVFIQTPPELGNQYDDDRVLRSYLARTLPADVLADVTASLASHGRACRRRALPHAARRPRERNPCSRNGTRGATASTASKFPFVARGGAHRRRAGLVATAYERRHGAFSRVHQFALVYLFTPSTDLYNCPLAMTTAPRARWWPRATRH